MFGRESMFLYVVKSHMHKDEHMVIIEAVEGLFACFAEFYQPGSPQDTQLVRNG
jgi:hypothetical protein